MTRIIKINVSVSSKTLPRYEETTGKQLGYLFTTVFESGYSRWIQGAEIALGTSQIARGAYESGNSSRVKEGKRPLVWWGHDDVWEDPDLVVEIRYDLIKDGPGTGRGRIHVKGVDLENGFKALFRKDRSTARRCLSGDFDGPDADLWAQMVVFGKEVYG